MMALAHKFLAMFLSMRSHRRCRTETPEESLEPTVGCMGEPPNLLAVAAATSRTQFGPVADAPLAAGILLVRNDSNSNSHSKGGDSWQK